MRSIDADKTIGHLKTRLYESALNNATAICDVSYVFQDIADNRIETWIDEMPTVSQHVESVEEDGSALKHGHWIDGNGKPVSWDDMNIGCPSDSCFCSECGDWLTASDEYPAKGYYCPNCGAKMDEVEE